MTVNLLITSCLQFIQIHIDKKGKSRKVDLSVLIRKSLNDISSISSTICTIFLI